MSRPPSLTLFPYTTLSDLVRTTGIGAGLAIPHGKSEGMPGLAMAIGKPPKPMDFEAIDGKPVQLVVLLASPPDRTSDRSEEHTSELQSLRQLVCRLLLGKT